MRIAFAFGALVMVGGGAHADSQSSNTSSNSSSNNGVVRVRVVDTYCENGYCQRTVDRRVYRDDRRGYRQDRRGYRQDGRRYYREVYRDRRADRDDDD